MSLTLFDLTGKRALITGSSQGIGHALARGLAAAGAEIVMNGRDSVKLGQAAAALRAEGHVVHTLAFDVTDEITLKCGSAQITMKKDGTIILKGKDITIDGSGKINLKAGGDITAKGSKINMN